MPSFKCSGPIPKALGKYRAAQQRSFDLINELTYPVSMGLTSEALKLASALQTELKLMASLQRRIT